MRRYPVLFVLLLSFLMPLQSVAEELFAPNPCPAEMAMDSQDDGNMPCCPDSETVPLCKTLKSCHLCKTPAQPIAAVAALPSLPPVVNARVIAVSHHLPMNFANIWRPPTHT
jgi:hypothetical protein